MKNRGNLLKFLVQKAIFLSLFSLLSGCTATKQNAVMLMMKTSVGEVQIALYQDKAPLTVNNFLQYVDAGGYDGGTFYRVVRPDNDNGNPKITVIQGGANGDFQDHPAIALESTETTGIVHSDGTLSMARAAPDTATSAFFICIGEQPGLDFGGKRAADGLGFAAFGRVVKGMDVIRQINQIRQTKGTQNAYLKGQMLTQPVVIESIRRL